MALPYSACVMPFEYWTASAVSALLASVPGHCPAMVMNSVFCARRVIEPKAVACARWQLRHMTFSVPVVGPAVNEPLLLAWLARVAMVVVPSSYGTSEVYEVACVPERSPEDL